MGYVPPPLIPLTKRPDFQPPGQGTPPAPDLRERPSRQRGPTCEYCGTLDVVKRCENCGANEPRPVSSVPWNGTLGPFGVGLLHTSSGLPPARPKFPENRTIGGASINSGFWFTVMFALIGAGWAIVLLSMMGWL